MEKVLELNIEKNDEIVLTEESNNIFKNVSEAFSNAMKKCEGLLQIPDEYKDVVKDSLDKIDLKELANSATEGALRSGMKSLGMKVSTFDNIKDLFDAIKEGDLKKGLSEGIDLAVATFKIPTALKNTIKSGKTLILDKAFEDELKVVMEKQKNTISRINKKCDQIERAIEENDIKTIEKVSKTLKTDLTKVMPIETVIKRGKEMLNQCELYKNKDIKILSQEEKELCKNLA